MDNFFSAHPDLQFHFRQMPLEELFALRGEAAPAERVAFARRKLAELAALAEKEFAPRAAEADREGCRLEGGRVILSEVTKQDLAALKAGGFMGVTLPQAYGGLALPASVYAMMNEILSRADASLQNLFGLQVIGETLWHFGSEEQRARVLPHLAAGEWDGAMVLTEPEAGSDLQSVQTKAILDENGVWRLTGRKHFITNGCAKVLLVLARSEEGTRDGRGLSLFLAHPCPEITVARLEDKLGLHASPTCELHFDNAPAELVGRPRFGLVKYVMSMMNGARLMVSAQALGVAEAARNAAWDYCRQRRQFGKTLCDIAPVREMLTRIDALAAASRALLYDTCRHIDLRDAWEARAAGGDAEAAASAKQEARLADVLTPMTKAFCTEAANRCAYDALQCLGGKGYMREYPVERLLRDVRIMNIYEGTTQMQIVAATAGLLKNSLQPAFDELDARPCDNKAMSRLKALRERLLAAQRALPPEHLELLSRRLVHGLTVVLAGQLLLHEGTQDPARRPLAERFLWEYLSEAEEDASVLEIAPPTL